MAAFHGKDGRVYWDTKDASEVTVQHITSWNVDATSDTAESTEMGSTWKSYTSGFKDWTATVEAYLDSAGADIPITTSGDTAGLGDVYDADGTTKVKAEFWFGDAIGDGYLTGDCVCTGVSYNQTKDDNVTVTYTFQGNGTLSYATS